VDEAHSVEVGELEAEEAACPMEEAKPEEEDGDGEEPQTSTIGPKGFYYRRVNY
jgi:hypothetical protein